MVIRKGTLAEKTIDESSGSDLLSGLEGSLFN